MESILLVATVFSAIAAVGSWFSAKQQCSNELFRYKVRHISKLKNIWKLFNSNIKHISNYKTTIEVLNKTSKDVIISMEQCIEELLLNNIETKKLFGNKVNKIELSFIGSLKDVIPSSEDWSTYHITEQYEKSVRIYKDLCREFDKL